jgi:hypothetical protein
MEKQDGCVNSKYYLVLVAIVAVVAIVSLFKISGSSYNEEKSSVQQDFTGNAISVSTGCTDTDFGLNYTNTGSINYQNKVYNDYCTNTANSVNKSEKDAFVREYYCDKGKGIAKTKKCNGICINGSCDSISTCYEEGTNIFFGILKNNEQNIVFKSKLSYFCGNVQNGTATISYNYPYCKGDFPLNKTTMCQYGCDPATGMCKTVPSLSPSLGNKTFTDVNSTIATCEKIDMGSFNIIWFDGVKQKILSGTSQCGGYVGSAYVPLLNYSYYCYNGKITNITQMCPNGCKDGMCQ